MYDIELLFSWLQLFQLDFCHRSMIKIFWWYYLILIVCFVCFSAEDDENAYYLSLKLLDEWQAFESTEAIEEVAGQASGEASLETMLKKVPSFWRAFCLHPISMTFLYNYVHFRLILVIRFSHSLCFFVNRWKTHGRCLNSPSCLIVIPKMSSF